MRCSAVGTLPQQGHDMPQLLWWMASLGTSACQTLAREFNDMPQLLWWMAPHGTSAATLLLIIATINA